MKRRSFAIAAAFGLALTMLSGTALANGGGNSAAAKACQQGGYENLYRTDGTGFRNAGECSSYAAQGGTFATRQTATLTNVVFSACNGLTLGYTLDGASHDLESKEPGCFTAAGSDHTIEFLSSQELVLFLRDDKCGYTFDQNGSHARVVGTNPYEVDIADGGFFCESPPDDPRQPGIDGNLSLTETIS